MFRAFVHFQPVGEYIPGQIPHIREERTIWLDALPIATAAYWLGGEHAHVQAPRSFFETLARRIPSRFFTMDVAQGIDGTWNVVELGDGQVAGLLPGMDRAQFYDTLYTQLHRATR